MPEHFREILYEISEILKSGGIQNYFAEARILASKVLNRPVNQIHPAMNIELSDEQLISLKTLVDQRLKGEPLQLITGFVGFHNCVLFCEPGVFIPRIETEVLVNKALDYLDGLTYGRSARILDLGTGSGAIIIALSASAPGHQFYGIDRCEKAIDLAKRNADLNRTQDKSIFYVGDYFDPVRGWDNVRFDLIISNPPYIKTGDIDSLDREVQNWDPVLALDGGVDGLDHYRMIAQELGNFLSDDGIALFEIDPEYVHPLEIIFTENGFKIVDIHKDLDGNNRVIEIVTK